MKRQTLDKVVLSGFKSIKSMDLVLSELNILIGANGVGKSNFVSLFKLLNNIVEQNLQFYVSSVGGAEYLLHFGRKTTEEISIKLSFASGSNGYECILSPNNEGNLSFKEESCWFHDTEHHPKPYANYLGSGHKETELTRAAKNGHHSRIASYVLDYLKSWKIYHFHDTSVNSKMKQACSIDDNRILRPDAANLAAFLYRLRERSHDSYRNIVETIQMVAPFFDDFVLKPLELTPDKIRIEWRQKGSDNYFNAFSLSDGTLRFICLATLLLQPNLPSTILLDEPELGLHPHAISVLAGLLRSSSHKTQVIVSTQSVTLVNQFVPKDVIVVEMEEGRSTFKHLRDVDMQDWLDDFGLGDLWEKNNFGGRPQL